MPTPIGNAASALKNARPECIGNSVMKNTHANLHAETITAARTTHNALCNAVRIRRVLMLYAIN